MKPTAAKAPATTSAEDTSYPITLVSLDHLLAHSKLKNRPIDKAHADELYESIKKNGLDTPLNTWNGGSDDGMMTIGEAKEKVPANFLIAGFHRREALRRLRKEDSARFDVLFPGGIPVRRRGGQLVDMLALQIRENANRKDPSLAELLPMLKELRDTHKMKGAAIAKLVGKSEAWVSSIIGFLENAGEEAVAAAQDSSISFREAVKLGGEIKKAEKAAGRKLTDDEKTEKVAKAKKNTAASKSNEKRVSAKALYGRYLARAAKITAGRKLTILEETFAYVAGESDDLPPELAKDDAKPAKPAKA